MADHPKFGVFAPQGWRMDLVHITDPAAQYEAMSHVAQEAERLGFDSVWLYDHFHTVPQPTLNTTFECWVSTAALARDTQTIRLGQMVGCIPVFCSFAPGSIVACACGVGEVLMARRTDPSAPDPTARRAAPARHG